MPLKVLAGGKKKMRGVPVVYSFRCGLRDEPPCVCLVSWHALTSLRGGGSMLFADPTVRRIADRVRGLTPAQLRDFMHSCLNKYATAQIQPGTNVAPSRSVCRGLDSPLRGRCAVSRVLVACQMMTWVRFASDGTV